MSLPDISVRRPVLAMVLNLLVVLIGAVALSRLPVRELPQTDAAEITVSVDYAGASPDVVDAQIVDVIEGALAGINGVQSMNTESERGGARTVLVFDPSRNIDTAANDVRSALDRVTGRLPDGVDPPQVDKNDSEGDPVIRLALSSREMTPLELSDYADRYLLDRFTRLPGVANAAIFGGRSPAMRVWLDTGLMAAHGVTAGDIQNALQANNLELPAGEIETGARQLQVLARTRLETPEQFRELVVRDEGLRPLRLGDVAQITLAPEGTESIFRSDGEAGLGIGIQPQAQANTVAIAEAVRAEVARISQSLPEGTEIEITTDEAQFIETTLDEVAHVFFEAVVLVTVVIFLFLGSLRMALIPAVTIPVSVLGAAAAMLALGYTINILTLFALILAIGLVVDDAIVVLENIQRHKARGASAGEAARNGANQVNFAVIATTAVLIAVFLPVSFMEGEIGQLFREFGIVLAVAVAVSGFVALTLSPALAAWLLAREARPNLLSRGVETVMGGAERFYRRSLGVVIARPELLLGLTAFVMAASFSLYRSLPQELTPEEDRGQFQIFVTTAQGSSLNYTDAAVREVEAMLAPLRDAGTVSNVTTIVGVWGELRRAMLYVNLAPFEARERSVQQVIADLRGPLSELESARIWIRPAGGLGISSGRGGLDFFLGGPSIAQASEWGRALLPVLEADPVLSGAEIGYNANQPGAYIDIDRLRAQDLGLDAEAVSASLQALVASRQIGEYTDNGRQYPVILQARPEDRDTPSDLMNILLRNDRGDLIPLSAVAALSEAATLPEITRQDRIHAVEVEADMVEGADLAQVMARVQGYVNDLPSGASLAWDGQAADFARSSGGMASVFIMALAIVFLVLAAQFESFRTPLVILLTVPLGLGGAVLALWLAGQSVNIYSQVGLVLLVGLMAKNGILMVEFANQLREEGASLREAALEGAVTRLRPIVMTTIATVLGALPLALATGAGAESRTAIGLVITGGLSFAFVLTLFVTPVIYVLVGSLRLPRRRPAASEPAE